jgi:predicted secreted acid phosphatase
MKRVILFAILGLGLSACATTPQHGMDAVNLSTTKAMVRDYHQSGRYAAETKRIALQAREYLEQRLAAGVQKPAIVFDVDETLISNYGYYDKEVDFGYIPHLQKGWEDRAVAPAISPVRDLCRYAISKGVAVFVITARPEAQRKATNLNLKRVGCYPYEKLYLRADPNEPSARYKTSSRRVIEQNGYTILVNIGDQNSDLTGGYSERDFKLPNHMYFVP